MSAVPGTVQEIVQRAAMLTGLTRAEIVGDCRQRTVARARFAVCVVASRKLGRSSVAIGRALGDRDHTSILYALRRAETLVRDDEDFARLVSDLGANTGSSAYPTPLPDADRMIERVETTAGVEIGSR